MVQRVLCILVLCTFLLLPLSTPAVSSDAGVSEKAPYVFVDSWGNEIGVFGQPHGIAVDGDRVYVADTGNHRIQVFDRHGKPLMTFGSGALERGSSETPRASQWATAGASTWWIQTTTASKSSPPMGYS